MRATILALSLLAFSLAAFAEGAEVNPPPSASSSKAPVVFDRYPNALGFYADFASTSLPFAGLCYQHWSGPFGLQAALSVNISSKNASDAAAVGEAFWRVYAEDYANWLSGALYLVALGGVGYGQETIYDNATYASSIVGPYLRIMAGAGIGFEVALFGHFSTDLQFLYRAVYKNGFEVGLSPGFDMVYRY